MFENTDIGVGILNALDNGNPEKIENIISGSSRNLNEVTLQERWNWLHKALSGFDANKPPRKSIEHLINQGVPINAQDCYGMTPLHYAMRSGNAEAAIALLEAGADPNIANVDGLRPLSMVGYTKDRLDVLEMMLKKGGDVRSVINGNETILESWTPSEYAEQWEIDIYEMMKGCV